MRRKCTFPMLFILILSLIFSTASVNLSPVIANPATQIYVDPPYVKDTDKTPGTSVTVNVNVAEVNDFFGYDFKLKYNTTVLNATSITVGPCLQPDYMEWHKEINYKLGYVWLAVSQFTGESGVNIPGIDTLAIISFTVLSIGESKLELYNTKFSDSSATPISHDTYHGYFSNTGFCHPVIEFTFTPDQMVGTPVTFGASYNPQVGNDIYGWTGIGSYDPDGTISCNWDFGDGKTGSGEIVDHVYTESGNYDVTLTVTDNEGNTNTLTKKVKVLGHDIAVINVQPNQTYVLQDSIISINVTVKNKAPVREDPIVVTAYYDGTGVTDREWIDLEPYANRTVTFFWNTFGVALGTYIISASASLEYISPPCEDENPADNSLINGTVTVVLTKAPDIAVIKVTPSKHMVMVGDNVNINVTVANLGLAEGTFNASLYYDTTLIDTQYDITLPEFKSQTLVFWWGTTDVQWGSYSINASVSEVPDEYNTTNNNLTDGIVTVALNDILVSGLTVSPTPAVVGTKVKITVTLKNKGNQNATFTVSFYYDNTWIKNQTVTDMIPGPKGITDLTVTWDTEGVPLGPYIIKAKVPPLDGEFVVTDNERTAEVILEQKMSDIEITDVTADPTTVLRGKTVTITVTIKNKGNMDETVSASVSYDTTLIETKTGITLTMGESKTLDFTWNTPANIALKTYTIKAEVPPIPGETDTTDNTKTTEVTVVMHDITVVSVTVSKTEVAVGGSVVVTVLVKNQGNFTESFSVTAKYDGNTIGTPVDVELADGRSKTVIFIWSTTGVSPGTYKIKASASEVTDEDDTTNNIREDGTVTVKLIMLGSTITISATPNTVTVGDEVTISGSINLTRPGVKVTIWYKIHETDTWNNLTATQTNATSQYSHTWTPQTAGTYDLKASWEGDANTLPDESEIFTITVNETPQQPGDQQGDQQGGIPLWLILAVGVVIVLVIAIAVFLRRR